MTYDANETGATTARPIEVYTFSGTYNTYRFTSSSFPIQIGPNTFVPLAIKRDKLKVGTQEQSEAALEIELPYDHPMVQEYAYRNAPPDLMMIIERCHEYDYNDRVTLWSGRVTSFTVEGRLAKMRVPALFSYVLEGNTPNPRFQAPCNHVLYDERCGVNPALHQHVTTVTSINNNLLTVNNLPFAENEASAGIIIAPSGEARMVISNLGTSLVLSYSFAGLRVNDAVTIRKGCDHSLEGHCKTRFNNAVRFGGFPLVPDRNPFTSSLE